MYFWWPLRGKIEPMLRTILLNICSSFQVAILVTRPVLSIRCSPCSAWVDMLRVVVRLLWTNLPLSSPKGLVVVLFRECVGVEGRWETICCHVWAMRTLFQGLGSEWSATRNHLFQSCPILSFIVLSGLANNWSSKGKTCRKDESHVDRLCSSAQKSSVLDFLAGMNWDRSSIENSILAVKYI